MNRGIAGQPHENGDHHKAQRYGNALADHLADPVVQLDAAGNIQYVNNACAAVFGSSPERYVRRDVRLLVRSEERQTVSDAIEDVAAQQKKRQVRLQHRTGGGERWFDWSLTAMAADNGNQPASVVCVGRDVTDQVLEKRLVNEQTQLLEAVEEAQELFISSGNPELVFEEMLHILVRTTNSEFGFLDEVRFDPDGTPYKVSLAMSDVSWNERSKQLYEDLRAQRLEFRNLNNLAGAPVLEQQTVIANDVEHDARSGGHPKGHPRLKTYMGIPLFFGATLIGVAGVANRKEGYTNTVAERISPLTKACAAIIGAGRMARREQETVAALRDSENRYRRMAETANEGILSIDPAQRIVFVNKHMADMLGYKPEEMIGRTYDSLTMADEIDDHMNRMIARQEGKKDVYERRLCHKSGREVWALVSATATQDENGQFSGSFAMMIDITDRKRTEQETQTLLNEKEVLLRETHHRVKNNMHVIESLLNLSADNTVEPAASALREAEGRVHGMSLLYEQLYRSEMTGSLSIQGYLCPLISDIVNVYPQPHPAVLDDNLSDTLLDAKRLTTLGLLVNEFVTNTMKYAFPVKPGTITISDREDDGEITFLYADDGVGLPAVIARRVFGTNAVLSDSAVEASTGAGPSGAASEVPQSSASSGFGLQLVRVLIDQLKAKIAVDVRNGTRFEISFSI